MRRGTDDPRRIMDVMAWGMVLVLAGGTARDAPNPVEMDMVKIPGGVFQMGSNTGRADEGPPHEVLIHSFYLGRSTVTVGQFRTFVDQTGYVTEAESGDGSVVFAGKGWEKQKGITWRNPGYAQSDEHPVTCVSYNDCLAYVRWLNAKTGKTYRLPTEAEWEYAASCAGAESGQGNIDAVAWHDGNAGGEAHPVRQKQPNAWGLFDMLGNVWEWCSDWYGPYPGKAQTDPQGPGSGTMRVNRGGAWYGADWTCLTRRGKNTPDDRGHGLGFRLARSAAA